jgi:VIT1/CCC1 family predicted Fe2+/Mn2+ transporter
MSLERLMEAELKLLDADALVAKYEVTVRAAFDTNSSITASEVHHRNLNMLRREIYRRMGEK